MFISTTPMTLHRFLPAAPDIAFWPSRFNPCGNAGLYAACSFLRTGMILRRFARMENDAGQQARQRGSF
jgi:hypothetical protein